MMVNMTADDDREKERKRDRDRHGDADRKQPAAQHIRIGVVDEMTSFAYNTTQSP